MKIPAIRGRIGTWVYYVGTMTFSDISKVKSVNKELHEAKTLSEMIQRAITNNYKAICEYILTQDERFLGCLVLAVYDGEPQWIEVEIDYGDEEFFNMGFLQFSGEEKVFPIDGQHRVEGIKAALKQNPELQSEKIPVVFIGHKNTKYGRERSRRLFATLNRYAKPVSMSDIIALDEDDVVAIVTRELIEKSSLFEGDNIVYAQQKGIPDRNKSALTSVITLYQCNDELLKHHLGHKNLKRYKRLRPPEKEIEEFGRICFSFWESFSEELTIIREFLSDRSSNRAKKWRNETGGNLLFRPIGLLPFVKAAIKIKQKSSLSFTQVFKEMDKLDLTLAHIPWKQVLWNDYEKKMLKSDDNLVRDLMIYQVNSDLLLLEEIKKIKTAYAGKISFQGDSSAVLDGMQRIEKRTVT